MMQEKVQTILLPTDFSIRSLQVMKHVLERDSSGKYNFVCATGLNLSGYITDLLFFSRKDLIKKLQGKVFTEAIQIIRNKYVSQVNSIRCEIFTGFTQSAFNLFLDGNKIDSIYIPGNQLTFSNPSFDLIPFMKKSDLPRHIVSWEEDDREQEDSLGELFKSWA